ncbi:hypothetical protein HETIRDRAFT_163661 [Heterobasidion irregulare TC 32-1]|uniref:DUF4110 domain-containing protein n=1 Tax=Heterobasidion irregulare (strain TC 32-1) TaxID=747525 RepID=W4JX70_HETIT|nr:uncharacterized protein HETIRDRAFT_163661 [Heterobasidion irregulare TC 32-1]ETW77675.1 hypothetical protein HETIRDRAFT_163661 [Heterobasidion irregulare TC 32-1]
MRREWEESHAVVEELVEGPPSRRANATLTACPTGNHLWCIGGEFFGDDGKAYFYNDVFRYTPEKDEWRKFISPECPGPRSAHAVAAAPMGGGKLFLFGGEFSSLYQNTFHHYRDFWCFDIATHSWDRIDTKVRPSARSGHRIALWKHYIVLFGGFYDPGVTTRYLNDLWIFDIQEYKWTQIEFNATERRPSPRSGFSFLPTQDGILLHGTCRDLDDKRFHCHTNSFKWTTGGYCKEFVKGKRPVGVMLEDTWFLSMSIATSSLESSSKRQSNAGVITKWEKRKRASTAFIPSLRSGCTMTLWSTKGMGVMFGGVTDEDTSEETLESVFHQDLNGYHIGTGKWSSMMLKRPKKPGGAAKRKKIVPDRIKESFDEKEEQNEQNDSEGDSKPPAVRPSLKANETLVHLSDMHLGHDVIDPDDPVRSTPQPRYNTMLAVLRNTLYIYGGIFERGSREYTLDDFYALALDKMDRYLCLKESGVLVPPPGEESSSSDDEDTDGTNTGHYESEGETALDDGIVVESTETGKLGEMEKIGEDDLEEPMQAPKEALLSEASKFEGVAKELPRAPEDITGTPLPGETLATFYARTREHWAQKACETSENRGKMLRRDGFSHAEERYGACLPLASPPRVPSLVDLANIMGQRNTSRYWNRWSESWRSLGLTKTRCDAVQLEEQEVVEVEVRVEIVASQDREMIIGGIGDHLGLADSIGEQRRW